MQVKFFLPPCQPSFSLLSELAAWTYIIDSVKIPKSFKVNMFLLEDFSNEMLEIILGHLDISKCLRDLTEVSPRFENIISSSFRLMRGVVISWNVKKDSLEMPSKHRKYIFLEIANAEGCSAQLRKFIETFADTLIGIRFYCGTFEMADLHSLLSVGSCPKTWRPFIFI